MKYNLDKDLVKLQSLYPSVASVFDVDFLNNLASGRTELNENDFCIKTSYTMREPSEQFFESHRAYIDIHITLSGIEYFAVSNIESLNMTADYDAENDCLLYDKSSNIEHYLSSQAKDVLIFGPEDGHMTAIGDIEDSVEKVIVKVLCASSSN
ncbi:YhcH/YjgK/YiaL family protein [Mollicutes bacterium LVI A0039]|nr:YhcH/YjgK/YiaL family protein [Mollicutes bacterium LVI A0039]